MFNRVILPNIEMNFFDVFTYPREVYYPQNYQKLSFDSEKIKKIGACISYVEGEENVSLTVESISEDMHSLVVPKTIYGKEVTSVNYGENVDSENFGAYKSVAGISYEWFKLDSASENEEGVATGVTTADYTLEKGLPAGTHKYYCIVRGDNYELKTRTAEVLVEKRASEINIEEGKDIVTIKCLDTDVTLEGITITGDGNPVYTVTEGADVVSVSEDGKITDLKEGTAVLTISMEETANCLKAEDKTITIIVEKPDDNVGEEDSDDKEETGGNTNDDNDKNENIQPPVEALSVGTEITDPSTGYVYKVLSSGNEKNTVAFVKLSNKKVKMSLR